MTKGQMKEVLEKVEALEKILMRELDEQEIEYLKDHSINEFIYDVLEFDKEDLMVLLKVKKIISDWCTRPEEDFNDTEENIDLFKDIDESLISEADINLFKETPHKVNNKVSQLLSTIISEFNDSIKPRRIVKVTSAEKAQPISESFDFTDDSEIPNEFGEEINEEDTVSIMDAVPENAKKWAKDLSVQEINNALKNATDILIKDYLEKHPNIEIGTIYERDFQINDDEMVSEVVDQIKDVAVRHYTDFLKEKSELELEDDEIRSEVLDYLYRHNYKVKTINNKISLV